jgi:hypothetical protein
MNLTSAGTAVYVFQWATGVSTVRDTIEDYNNNRALSELTAPWSSATQCGGASATLADDNIWLDVTTTSGGAASTCAADAARCTFQDKITGLWWSKTQSTSISWAAAMATCEGLNYNGQTGWRLPTQKELMDAYSHGIYTAPNANWITKSHMDSNWFWSSSSVSGDPAGAGIVSLHYSYTNSAHKTVTNTAVCVR